ncbi:hypothetical protein LDDCCGHA_0360 [Methylobacterium oxalidis]|nr:hypothetical protein LDDCCGHA_0360 [Methylobacterium oxalidis]
MKVEMTLTRRSVLAGLAAGTAAGRQAWAATLPE